jgi:ketosteroid isomerase-like protein
VKYIGWVRVLALAPMLLGEPHQEPTEDELRGLNQRYCSAVEHGDIKTLEELFDKRMLVTDSRGLLRDRTAELADLKPSPSRAVLYFRAEDVHLRSYGDSAVVVGKLRWRLQRTGSTVEPSDGVVDFERRYSHFWVRSDKKWRIVAQHVSLIAKPQEQSP